MTTSGVGQQRCFDGGVGYWGIALGVHGLRQRTYAAMLTCVPQISSLEFTTEEMAYLPDALIFAALPLEKPDLRREIPEMLNFAQEFAEFCLASDAIAAYDLTNTLAAPLSRKGDVHQGRVFYCARHMLLAVSGPWLIRADELRGR